MRWKKYKDNQLLVSLLVLTGGLVVATTILSVRGEFLEHFVEKIAKFRGTPEEQVLPDQYHNSTPENNPKEQEAILVPDYLVYATTTNSPHDVEQRDLYIGEDTKNNLRLLHYKKKDSDGTVTYPIFRIYPQDISTQEIIADYESEKDSRNIPDWFGKQPSQLDTSVRGSLLTGNLIIDQGRSPTLPDWLLVPRECFTYIPGNNCRFEITNSNPYNLPPVILTKETGPYEWSDYVTPHAIYVTKNNHLLLQWAFGDAGATYKVASLWDPVLNTHTKLSSLSGMEQSIESLSISDKSYTYAYIEDGYATTTLMLKQEPFSGWSIYGRPLQKSCYGVHFYPTNLVETSATWLVEYTYGCPEETIQGLSAWYELDPTVDSLRPLTGVIPR